MDNQQEIREAMGKDILTPNFESEFMSVMNIKEFMADSLGRQFLTF